MKNAKLLMTICLVALLAAVMALTASAEGYLSIGDVDGDGSVTSADARLALRASVSLENYPEDTSEFYAADADYDGRITSADARLILRASVGLEYLVDFGTMLEDTPDYRIGLDSWWWDTDEDGLPYATVYLVVQNTSDQYEDFSFYNWAVNDCMTPAYGCENEWHLLEPGEATVYCFNIYIFDTPLDFEMIPVGSVSFSFMVSQVKNPMSEMEEYIPIGDGDYRVYDEALLEYAHYEPTYLTTDYDLVNDHCNFVLIDDYYETWVVDDDTETFEFLYKNNSDFEQIVEFELTAINGTSLLNEFGEGVTSSSTVHNNCSGLLFIQLFRDYQDLDDYEYELDRLGLNPRDIVSVEYNLNIYDYYSGDLVFSTPWTITKGNSD